jgi:adenosylcobinamide-phosphate synthase
MTLFDMPNVLVLLLALVIDQAIGEPPNAVHPVVWMGNSVSFLMKGAKIAGDSKAGQFIYGMLVSLVTIGIFTAASYFLLAWIRSLSLLAYVIVGAILLKCAFSLKELRNAAVKVRRLLEGNKIPEARAAVKALVGRDTTQLDSGQVASATIESVAENSCDSFVAPLLFFIFLGVPGAFVYRAVNTLDNSIGFRGKYEYLGKFAARLDDVVNFIPARINAFLFVVAALFNGKDFRGAWRIMFRDHGKTASPNGGWTMGAMAGGLGVRLEKINYYKLGDNRNTLTPRTIDISLDIMTITAVVWTVILVGGQAGYYVLTQA